VHGNEALDGARRQVRQRLNCVFPCARQADEAAGEENKQEWKTGNWILMSPTMVLKGVRGTNNEAFQLRVDRLYGNTDWRRVQRAFDQHTIVSCEYREQIGEPPR
jgi:hypothetical protein